MNVQDCGKAESGTGHSGELLAEAIEAIGFGIVLVTDDGFITFANTMARDLISRGEGLRGNSGWLAGTTAEVTTRLRSLLKSGSKPAGQAGSGATIILARGASRPSLFVHVMSLGRRGKQAADAPTAVVFIIDPELYALPSFDAFATLYGLTRAEARVLQQIIGGQGLVAAAAKLRISEATARTHLQRIFDKTETKRQTELLCLFFKAALPGQMSNG